ncbi:hypothetical protein CMUS01_03327 [Colletotrichum musicola]|uniref:Uncharacterized protein n=1 Tax=Colletotrichum musicola TaxID=2175873 RepID=A0A8H6NTB0_9PEZI|nr:hypothetical protein CMUS01_03327 [Colletotrichum musicola]
MRWLLEWLVEDILLRGRSTSSVVVLYPFEKRHSRHASAGRAYVPGSLPRLRDFHNGGEGMNVRGGFGQSWVLRSSASFPSVQISETLSTRKLVAGG